MMSEHVGNWWRRFECCILNTKEVRSSNKFKKHWSWPCNRWVLVRNPDTPKEFVQFVHKVRPVYAVTLSTLSHMLCGSNDDTMPTFNHFRVHLKCFSISGSFSSKKLVNAWKITDEVRKGENWWCGFESFILNTQKVRSSNKFKKKNPFVTDEFSSETLILRKRLSILQTKCIQFLP